MARKKTISVMGECEHGTVSEMVITLPIRAQVLDCSEEEDGSEVIVWLTANEGQHFVETVTEPLVCGHQAELIAAALNKFLATKLGQKMAIAYIRHRNEKQKATTNTLDQAAQSDDNDNTWIEEATNGQLVDECERRGTTAKFLRRLLDKAYPQGATA